MKKSLADELDGVFEDVSLSPGGFIEPTENPKESGEENTANIREVEVVVLEDAKQGIATDGQSAFPAIANKNPGSPAILVTDDEDLPAAHTVSYTAPSQTFRKTNFIEHLSPVDSRHQPISFKEHQRLLASKHNRDLIDRNADGFFDMERMPKATDVQRRVQQSQGIAALQRTLVPATIPDAASSTTGSSHASSSTAVDSVKDPSTLRHVTFAESKARRRNNIQGPFPYPASRPKAAARFSLARDLIAAGHRNKPSEPSAPARFVKTPADPVLNFKRNFAECGLKIRIPESDDDEYEGDGSGSITSVPDVDSAGGFTFETPKPRSKREKPAPKLDFGVPRAFMPNQCLESTCPMRWAHAKGPYHHKGRRPDKIMTGLFGHSNPPPEIWNAYRNMVQLTCDGEIMSPDERPRSQADNDLVIAFATLHHGGLNGMSGEEFRRRYAGKHIPSRIALQPARTSSSQRSSLESFCQGLCHVLW